MSLTDAQVAEIAGMTAGTSLGVRARELAREVQELRHLRDDVLPDLRQELDVANAHLADYRTALVAARAFANASEAEMERLAELVNPDGDFLCPSDPCPYCTALEEFLDADTEAGI